MLKRLRDRLRHGRAAGAWVTETEALCREIAASGLFDAAFYRARHDGVPATHDAALRHFLRCGLAEGHQPSARFDPIWYAQQYPDIVAAGALPLLHYIRHGRDEGRQGTAPVGSMPRVRAASADTEKGRSAQARHCEDFSDFEQSCLFAPYRHAPFSEATIRAIGYMAARKRHVLRTARAEERLPGVTVVIPWRGEALDHLCSAVISAGQQEPRPREILVLATKPVTEAITTQLRANVDGPMPRYLEAPEDVCGFLACVYDAVATPWLVWLEPGDRLGADYMRIMSEFAPRMRSPFVLNCGRYCAITGSSADDEDHSTLASVTLEPLQASCLEHRGRAGLSGLLHETQQLGRLPRMQESLPIARLPWLLTVWLAQQAHGSTVPCLLVEHQVVDAELTANAPPVALEQPVRAAIRGACLADSLPDVPLADLRAMYAPRVPALLEPDAYRASVVIPNYECADELNACVQAVRRFSPSETELVIVDNGSGVTTQRVLGQLERLDRVTVIRNAKNLGFTYAVNQGISAVPTESDVVLLNNDAIVSPGWLDALQAVRVLVPEAGLIVPQQVLLANSPTMQVHHPGSNPQRELDVNLSWHHGNVLHPLGEVAPGMVALRFAPFFCVLIPREVLAALGPLDYRNGPHYRSDNLYCDAVRRILGRPVIHTSHSKVYHLLQRATTQLREADAGLFEAMFRRNEWSDIVGHPAGGPARED